MARSTTSAGKPTPTTNIRKATHTAKAHAISQRNGYAHERSGMIHQAIEQDGKGSYKNEQNGHYLVDSKDFVNHPMPRPKKEGQNMQVNETKFADEVINLEFDVNEQMTLTARVLYDGYDETYKHSTDEDREFIAQYNGMPKAEIKQKLKALKLKASDLVLG